MRSTCGVHVVWCHLFSNLLLNSPKSCDQSCDYVINLWLMWQCDRQTLTQVVLKIEKINEKEKENKIKWKEKIKMKFTVNDLDTPHFWHLAPWAWQACVGWPQCQQLQHWATPGCIAVPQTVAVWRPKLNERLMSVLPFEPFWESQMSIQITDMSELGEAFIMWGIEANETPSKRGEFERAASTWAG